MGDQKPLTTVDFTNNPDEQLLIVLVRDFEGLEGALERVGQGWRTTPPGAVSKRNWPASEPRDLSVRPLCQEHTSWYVLELQPTAEPGEMLMVDDLIVRKILEHPCWDDQHDRYTID